MATKCLARVLCFLMALVLTSSSGEKFTLDKSTIKFVLAWPFFLLADWSH